MWNHIISGFRIEPRKKSRAPLKNRLPEIKILIIDELSIVSSDLGTDIDSRFGEIFTMIPLKKHMLVFQLWM